MIRKQKLTKEELADLGKSEKKFWILLPLVLLIVPLAITWIFDWPWVVFWSAAAFIFVLVFSYYQSKGNQAIRKNRDKGIKWIRRGKIIDVERTMGGPDNTKVKYIHITLKKEPALEKHPAHHTFCIYSDIPLYPSMDPNLPERYNALKGQIVEIEYFPHSGQVLSYKEEREFQDKNGNLQIPINHKFISMNSFNNLFGDQKHQESSKDASSDNTALLNGLHAYYKNESADNYARVQDELFNGNAFLLLPSVNGSGPKETWKTLEEGADLKLTSVFDVDGLKILGAFTSKETLLKWAKKETEYTAMLSADVINLCEENSIDRIVIDSDQPTMFVLERQGARVESETIQQDTDVLVGTPSHPIEGALLEKLQNQLAKVSVIQEVYQFIMSRSDEPTLILCFKLDVYNDNARAACMNAVQDAMKSETIEQAVDVFFPKDKSWYETAKGVENSLVYKRP